MVDDVPYFRLIEQEKGYGQINIAAYLDGYAKDLAKKVLELRPSILHAASNHINGLVVNAVAKHFGIPSIYEVRGLWENHSNFAPTIIRGLRIFSDDVKFRGTISRSGKFRLYNYPRPR